MATAEDMLAQALEASGNYPILTVDWITRQIDIPKELKFLGVESDDDVRRIGFVMPKRYRDIDLSEFAVSINYLNANAEGDVYLARDIVIEGDNIAFTWLIGRRALAYKGDVKFNICLKKVDVADPTIVVKELNTTIASLPVLEGLETSEAVIQEYADILLQWERELETKFKTLESRIDEVVKEKTADDRIKEIVNAYLKENPFDTITEEELNAAVEEYFVKHPVDTVTDEELNAAVEEYLTNNPIEPDTVTDEELQAAIGTYLTKNPIEVGNTLPTGGNTGQVLTKATGADGDVIWDNPKWEHISGVPTEFTPAEHEHNAEDVGAVPAERVDQNLTTASEVTFKKVTADVVIGAVYM